ncbi:PREDICTED: uncharacterized protein LOC107339912 [Acropora digitifera]|uniref:uncharacterized protein LOC107339912 n=1 Tax=Acropora digitifera TaxID=70779 RepID=UPI00077A4C04|nr:PREDICTED: uncharacterized protein LOC107339912 [Acropora digitifera]
MSLGLTKTINDPDAALLPNKIALVARKMETLLGAEFETLDPILYLDISQSNAPEFALLYRVQSESYKKYNQEFVKVWQLKSTESIVMGPAAATYVDYESVLSLQDPKYLAIAMLPCTMLWPWIAGELIDSVHKDNPYYDWFAENKPDGHKSRLEEFVDYFFDTGDKAKSLVIFHQGLVNELNFFRNACDQTLYYYSSFNV